MRLLPDAGTLVMRGDDHWLRCGFTSTTLHDDAVTLTPLDPQKLHDGDPTPHPDAFAGLAFDRHCRLFHVAVAEDATRSIECVLWRRQSLPEIADPAPYPFEITGPESETSGSFIGPLPERPRALACDDADYLCIADDGSAPALWLVDIWQREVARRFPLDAVPLDVCFAGGKLYALIDAAPGAAQRWVTLGPCDPLRDLGWPAGLPKAWRLDVLAREGQRPRGFVLLAACTPNARVVCLDDVTIVQDVADCSDFAILGEGPDGGSRFVFARRGGADFEVRKFKDGSFESPSYLRAPNYDGRGIAVAPDDRVAYWTRLGLRHAAGARNQYATEGTVLGFALDSNREQNEWGRLCIEACIPGGTRVNVRCYTRDDLDYADAMPRTPPERVDPARLQWRKRLDLTPMPPTSLVASRPPAQSFCRDEFSPHIEATAPDAFALYDAPVIAPPGRFLWLELTLHGTQSKTPRVRAARVEFPGHNLLRQLPKTLWREPRARDFLNYYLMPIAATLDEWAAAAALRHRLIDPRIAPAEALEWLGSFVGLAMDPCWPESARRRMLARAVHLFRIRGTPCGLREMIEILTASRVIIVERFKLRSGGVAGNAQARESRSVLGAGFRVGGNVGATAPVELPAARAMDFDDYAHRFTVMVVARLSDAQLRCVRRLIETHKPAHTMFDLCPVDAGTRVGVGLHVGLASVIGPNSGFDPLTVGDAVLGKGYLLGKRPELERPAPAARAGQLHACESGGAP